MSKQNWVAREFEKKDQNQVYKMWYNNQLKTTAVNCGHDMIIEKGFIIRLIMHSIICYLSFKSVSKYMATSISLLAICFIEVLLRRFIAPHFGRYIVSKYLNSRKDMSDIYKYYISNERNNAWIIENNFSETIKPIGFIAVEINDKICELKGLTVHPNYRRMGIASMLHKTLEKYAKEKGVEKIILSCTIYQPEAIGFYKKHGFKIIKYEYHGIFKIIHWDKHL